MFCLHSDLTHAIVVLDVLHNVWSELPRQENTLKDYSQACSFHKIMFLYSICLVSTTCCDATIAQHKRYTNTEVT